MSTRRMSEKVNDSAFTTKSNRSNSKKNLAYDYKNNLKIPNFEKALQHQLIEEKKPQTQRQQQIQANKKHYYNNSSLIYPNTSQHKINKEQITSPRGNMGSNQLQQKQGLVTSQSVIGLGAHKNSTAGIIVLNHQQKFSNNSLQNTSQQNISHAQSSGNKNAIISTNLSAQSKKDQANKLLNTKKQLKSQIIDLSMTHSNSNSNTPTINNQIKMNQNMANQKIINSSILPKQLDFQTSLKQQPHQNQTIRDRINNLETYNNNNNQQVSNSGIQRERNRMNSQHRDLNNSVNNQPHQITLPNYSAQPQQSSLSKNQSNNFQTTISQNKVVFKKNFAAPINLIRVLINKMGELDRVTNYERSKVEEYKEEGNLLNEQIDMWKKQYFELQTSINDIRKEFSKHQEMVTKMEECQQELKQTLLNSLMCLDFYKDLESYIQENRYAQQKPEIIHHFDVIEELVQQHGLYSLDFDTERIQKLIDQIQDYIKVQLVEKKIIEISMNEQAILSDDDDYEREGLRVKVKRLGATDKQGSMGLVGNDQNRSQSRLNNNSRLSGQGTRMARGHSSHQQCVCNGNLLFQHKHLKEEIKDKNSIINRIREQLEYKMKKIVELKYQLKKERDKEHKKRQHYMYKDSIVKLEKDYNLLVIKNTKTQLDLQNEKEENENMRLELNKQKEMIKEYQADLKELRKCLEDKEGYQNLESTVNSLINMLLKSIFGNNSMLYKLRQRVQVSEEHLANLTQQLAGSVKLNLSFQDVIEDQWVILKQVYQAFRDTNFEELDNLNLMMLLQVLQPRLSDQYSDQQERDFAALLVQFKEIRAAISKEQIVEEMSKVMFEDKDKINILSMMIESKQQEEDRQKSFIRGNSTNRDLQAFSLIETPKQDKKFEFNFTNIKTDGDTIKSARPPLNHYSSVTQKFTKNQSDKQFEFQATKPRHNFNLNNVKDTALRNSRKESIGFVQDQSLIGHDYTDMNVQDFQMLFEQSKIVNDQNPADYYPSQKQADNYFQPTNKINLTNNDFRSGSVQSQIRHQNRRSTLISMISQNEGLDTVDQISQINEDNSSIVRNNQQNSRANSKVSKKQLKLQIRELKLQNKNLVNLISNAQQKNSVGNQAQPHHINSGINQSDLNQTLSMSHVNKITNDSMTLAEQQQYRSLNIHLNNLGDSMTQANQYKEQNSGINNNQDMLQILQIQSEAIESLIMLSSQHQTVE
eukprot:403340524